MYALIGNPHPIEVVEGQERLINGSQQTLIELPGPECRNAFQTIIEALKYHILKGYGPSSIFTPDPSLTDSLKSYFEIGGVPSMVNIRTNAGNDFVSSVLGGASNGTGSFAPATYMGLSADTTPENTTDTALPGEITSGALSRVKATYAHTTGSSTYSLTNIFISDQTVTLNKSGIFNTATNGTLFWEEVFPAGRSVNSGDQLSVTVSINF